MIKKLVSLLLAVTVIAGLASCAGTGSQDHAEEERPAAAEPAKSTALTVMDDTAPQPMYEEDGVSYAFRTAGKSFEIYNGSEFEPFYSVGVNIGSGKPNGFPGEMNISRAEYLKWLEEIAEMNANSIRVYTVLSPDFYDAFYIYNHSHEKKLYLFQGCWLDEEILAEYGDAYMTLDDVKGDIKDLIDIFHGNANIQPRTGHASGSYTRDISNYVAGWIMGIEPDANMVTTTNENNPDKTSYDGEYLACENVQPFETFWCELGDYAVSYEDHSYRTQRMVSFTNWPSADQMSHPDEPLFEMEDNVTLNVEDLREEEKFKPGLFASYHIYSYYPNFMFEDAKYKNYVDETGKINTYRAYLEDLIQYHTCPVLVAEFGLPVSRGITHRNPLTEYNQGGLTEAEQGEMLVNMFQDIRETGYAGALVFIWQDEWFKRTWNTMDYNNAERRPFWCDVQTCEQHFGLMEFVSIENKPVPVIDGKADEWTENELVFTSENGAKVYAKTDSTYFYLMVNDENADFAESGNQIYFDISPEKGGEVFQGTPLSCAADFVLSINGKDKTRMMAYETSDVYHYLFGEYDPYIMEVLAASEDKFIPIYLILDREMYLPDSDKTIPVQRRETGLFRYGTSDKTSANYDSLTDFCYKGDVFEARIPWQLLGFRDPSRKEIQGDFREEDGELTGAFIDGIAIGLVTPDGDQGSAAYTWNNWEYAETEERLRESYYIIQDYLAGETD